MGGAINLLANREFFLQHKKIMRLRGGPFSGVVGAYRVHPALYRLIHAVYTVSLVVAIAPNPSPIAQFDQEKLPSMQKIDGNRWPYVSGPIPIAWLQECFLCVTKEGASGPLTH